MDLGRDRIFDMNEDFYLSIGLFQQDRRDVVRTGFVGLRMNNSDNPGLGLGTSCPIETEYY